MLGARTNAVQFLETTDAGGSTTFTNNSAQAISPGAWHRVVLWRTASVIGIKVDNQTSETFATSGAAAFSHLRFRNGSSEAVTYDEIAVWRGYVPTESELRWDWNGGAGRTYPLGP